MNYPKEDYRETRETKGWSQDEAANIAGVDRKTINRREQGHSPIGKEAAFLMSFIKEVDAPGGIRRLKKFLRMPLDI